jgi:inhibitor of cysteine peptidase
MQLFKEEADSSEARIDIGEDFEICLAENPTTGFRWNVESAGEPACKLLSEHVSGQSKVPGNQRLHHWNFKAVVRGTSRIRLAYARAWQKQPPARTFTLSIRADGG